MKKLALIIISTVLSLSVSAQKDDDFSRKGKLLVEAGSHIFTGFLGGTGSSILFDDNNNITSIGFNGGYFLSDDFALKLGLGIFSSGGTIATFYGGGKYYLVGKIPIEAGVNFLSGNNESTFLGNASIGYGISLANNINLEPSIGIVFDDNVIGKFAINFSMFL